MLCFLCIFKEYLIRITCIKISKNEQIHFNLLIYFIINTTFKHKNLNYIYFIKVKVNRNLRSPITISIQINIFHITHYLNT